MPPELVDAIAELAAERGLSFSACVCWLIGTKNKVNKSSRMRLKRTIIDHDFLPTYGEKPASWKPSGKRGKKGDGIGRGQYKTAQGVLIN
ncbi:MAG: hypothetical protein ACRC62_15340 [Microcoleus sp.]